jgi:hypothetical protein
MITNRWFFGKKGKSPWFLARSSASIAGPSYVTPIKQASNDFCSKLVVHNRSTAIL